jgi:glycosyltransferase involved in cell wall biosynthesis
VKPIFIIVPKLDDSGPMKGAVAVANGLASDFDVILIAIKGIADQIKIKDSVRLVSLDTTPKWFDKLSAIRFLIEEYPKDTSITSVSFCFSADLMNWMLKGRIRIISSVRSNLWKNYYYTYGIMGWGLAIFHYLLLRSFDDVTALSRSMLNHLDRWFVKSHFIGNFIDEPALELSRSPVVVKNMKVPQFLFLGILNKRKRPDLLIECARTLEREGILFKFIIAGVGPLNDSLESAIKKFNLENYVILLGHVSNPYDLLQQSDYLIIPSESEGISRSALEALYFGIPCIMRNIDGNQELIKNNVNGFLFRKDIELISILKYILSSYPAKIDKKNLLPANFRYEVNLNRLKELIDK